MEIINLYSNKYKKITLNHQKIEIKNNDYAISFYTNNLQHLENIRGVKRVYLEIPPQNDSLTFDGEHYNINYMVTFIKNAFEISYGKDYKLIWKWPDITHDKLIRALNKVRGILNKMHYDIPIMSSSFNGEYGFYSMNVTNTETIKSLKGYNIVTLSPELRKQDYENIMRYCENPEKVEILVQGSVELMKTRYSLLYGNEKKSNYKNFLIDRNNNRYPIHKNLSGEEIIIFNNNEISLIEEINYLKSIGFCNFSIDGRFKDKEYYKMIEIYKDALNGHVDKKELKKYSPKNTTANY